MRARCYDFRLSVLGGVAIGLLAFAVPAVATVTSGAAALATSLDDAWRACNAPQLSSADRIAHCTTIIESDRAKPVALAQALTARGFGYVIQKDFDRALADFDAAIRNNPKLAAAYYYRAAIQMGRDPKGALADINKAISLNPRDPDYFRERSSLYAKRKEYPRAIADLTTAIGLAKKPTREYFLRGAAYEDIGQRDKAIADFQASLVLDPDNDVLRRHLVHLGGEIPKAVQLPSGLCSANDITHEQRIAGCTASIESGTLDRLAAESRVLQSRLCPDRTGRLRSCHHGLRCADCDQPPGRLRLSQSGPCLVLQAPTLTARLPTTHRPSRWSRVCMKPTQAGAPPTLTGASSAKRSPITTPQSRSDSDDPDVFFRSRQYTLRAGRLSERDRRLQPRDRD